MKHLSKLFSILLVAVLATGCSDDIAPVTPTVPDGQPATIKSMTIEVPANTEIANSRALQDIESEIDHMVIVMYSTTNGRQEVLQLTGKLADGGKYGTSAHCYTLTEDIQTLSGKYRAYVIANWKSNFANIDMADDAAWIGISESELKALIANNNNNMEMIGQYRLPMTQFIPELTIEEGVNTEWPHDNATIKLRRVSSRIEFKFVDGEGCHFTPTNYTVYNLPVQASLFDDRHFEGTNTTPYPRLDATDKNFQTFNSATKSITDKEFDFLMLESHAGNALVDIDGNTIEWSKWSQRENFKNGNEEPLPAAKRNFTNAPKNSTYVVVEGEYSDNECQGQTRYIIHLGNFSDNNNFSNFDVNRNERHTYTITVKGIKSIKAEVEVLKDGTEDNPGAEGKLIIEGNAKSITMDAHYGQVMIRIPKTTLSSGKTQFELALSTPKNPMANYNLKQVANGTYRIYNGNNEDVTDAADYKWIQFQKPTNETTFPTYAGLANGTDHSGGLNDGLGYITDFVQDHTKYCFESGENYYTVAWVDENFYSDMVPAKFVGEAINNRMFVFNPTGHFTSPDEQSMYITDYAFSISQKPIITVYDLTNPDYTNPFGLEQYEEMAKHPLNADGSLNTTKKEFDGKDQNLTNSGLTWIGSDISSDNPNTGIANTRAIFNGVELTPSILKTTNPNTNYGYMVNANGEYALEESAIDDTRKALISRNRDLDGNGTIDDDEIRWYIPTLTQYYTYFLGEKKIGSDKRLTVPGSNYFSTIDDNNIPRYFTSSDNNRRIYWHDQGVCSSNMTVTWLQKQHCIRFARNLGTGDATSKFSKKLNGKNVITVNSPEITRNALYTGNFWYTPHYERELQNTAPSAIEYDSEPYYLLYNSDGNQQGNPLYDATHFRKSYNTAETYSTSVTTGIYGLINSSSTNRGTIKTAEDNGRAAIRKKLAEGWRIPNQDELMLLFINQGEDDSYIMPDAQRAYLSYTWWTDHADRYPYMAYTNTNGYNTLSTTDGITKGWPVYIWLVRDYVPAANASNDASFSSGGSGSAIK